MQITDPFDQYDYLPCFSPRLAASLGKHCEGQAILLHQIEFWLSRPKVGKIVSKCVDKKHRIIQNRKWVRETLSDFTNQFPNTSKSTLRRILSSLIKKDLVIATNTINRAKFDRTTWYTVNFDKLWHIFRTSKYTDKIGNFQKARRTPKDVQQIKQDIQKYQTPYQDAAQFPSPRKCPRWTHDMFKKNKSSAQPGHMQVSKVDRPSAQVGHHNTLSFPKIQSKISYPPRARTRATKSKKVENSNKQKQPRRNVSSAPELEDMSSRANTLPDRQQQIAYNYQKYDAKVFNMFSKVLTDNIPVTLSRKTQRWFYDYKVDVKLVQVAIEITQDRKPDMGPNAFIGYVDGILSSFSYSGFHTYAHYQKRQNQKQKTYSKAKSSSTVRSPQPSDDNGQASALDRTAQVVHIQLTGNLDKETKKDYWYARLICKSNDYHYKYTGVDAASLDPKDKTYRDFKDAVDYFNQKTNYHYTYDDIKPIASLNRKFYDF